MPDRPHVVVVTGMSGAGKSAAADVLEDVGYFVVDNLPARLIEQVVEPSDMAERSRERLAVVVDARGGASFKSDLDGAILWLDGQGVPTTLLFLDADDEALHQRYEENRRPHPVPGDTLAESIAAERKLLEPLRGEADVVVDTSDLNVHELRDVLLEAFPGDRPPRPMRVSIASFGFKHGAPRDVDLLFDVRFLPNPHWEEELRPFTGRDHQVADYVFANEDARQFMRQVEELLAFLIPRFEKEGKAYLSIAIGCTGGRHRSVAIAEELARWLEQQEVSATVRHRDTGK
ncbi:MAG: RNase adapter RapZ [Actinomycetota bacterium]|nr:RNase adapter RapZ [Actinomycetota bacterium]